MRIDLYFPRGYSPEASQASVDAVESCGREAFAGRFGLPSVHGVESYRPEQDAETLVCVVTFNQTSVMSEQAYVTQKHAFLDNLFARLIEVAQTRHVRIEAPDGGTLHFTWGNIIPMKKSA